MNKSVFFCWKCSGMFNHLSFSNCIIQQLFPLLYMIVFIFLYLWIFNSWVLRLCFHPILIPPISLIPQITYYQIVFDVGFVVHEFLKYLKHYIVFFRLIQFLSKLVYFYTCTLCLMLRLKNIMCPHSTLASFLARLTFLFKLYWWVYLQTKRISNAH